MVGINNIFSKFQICPLASKVCDVCSTLVIFIVWETLYQDQPLPMYNTDVIDAIHPTHPINWLLILMVTSMHSFHHSTSIKHYVQGICWASLPFSHNILYKDVWTKFFMDGLVLFLAYSPCLKASLYISLLIYLTVNDWDFKNKV